MIRLTHWQALISIAENDLHASVGLSDDTKQEPSVDYEPAVRLPEPLGVQLPSKLFDGNTDERLSIVRHDPRVLDVGLNRGMRLLQRNKRQ